MSNSDRKTRDTVAMPVDLTKIYGKGLIPITPIYLSIPVIYREGIPTLDSDFKIESIPKKYRKDLLKTLMAEEGRIKEYLMIHKNGFKKTLTPKTTKNAEHNYAKKKEDSGNNPGFE